METFRQNSDRKGTRAFTGQGHTLGSPTPTAIGAPSIQEKDSVANEARAKMNLQIDSSQPTTK